MTAAMEYKKSDAESWTDGTGNDITGLVPGTYYVRYKATDTSLASDNQELTVAGYDAQTYTVTFKVVNGSWDNGTATDVTVALNGLEGDTLKLTEDQIPAVGTKPADNHKAGAWNVTPSIETAITADTTYTYTYVKEQQEEESQKIEIHDLTEVPEPLKEFFSSAAPTQVPKTGDGANPMLWLLLTVVGMIGVLSLAVLKGKKKKDR